MLCEERSHRCLEWWVDGERHRSLFSLASVCCVESLNSTSQLCVFTVLLFPLPVLNDLQSHLLVTPHVELLNLQVCCWTTALTALITLFTSLLFLSQFSFSAPFSSSLHLSRLLFPIFLAFLPLLPSHITSLHLHPPSSLAPHLCRCWQPI